MDFSVAIPAQGHEITLIMHGRVLAPAHAFGYNMVTVQILGSTADFTRMIH